MVTPEAMDIAYVSVKNKTIDNALYKQSGNSTHFVRPLSDFRLLESSETITIGSNQCLTIIDKNDATNEYLIRYYFNNGANENQDVQTVNLAPEPNHTFHYYKEVVDVNSDIKSIPTTVSLGYIEGENDEELYYGLIECGEPLNDYGYALCKVNQSIVDIQFSDMDVDPNTKSMARNIKNVQ